MSALLATLAVTTLSFWHATQGDERAALDRAVAAVNTAPEADLRVEALAIPFDAYAQKLETTIPHGDGPDLFLAAHDRLGDWRAKGLLSPLGPAPGDAGDALARAFEGRGERWAEPTSFKALLLYWNRTLIKRPPRDARELFSLEDQLRGQRAFALAYDTGSLFFHAPFLLATGGRVFDGDRIAVFDDESYGSFSLVGKYARAGVIPRESSSRLAAELFNAGRAALVLSGPWFAGDVHLPDGAWDVAPLFDVDGNPAGSFASVEGIFATRTSTAPIEVRARAARSLAEALARERARDPLAARLEAAERPALEHGILTPSRPEMALVWEPAGGLLRDVIDRDVDVGAAMEAARHALAIAQRPPPAPVSPAPYLAALGAILLYMAVVIARRASDPAFRLDLRGGSHAYAYVAPAFIAMLALVIAPFVAGAAISLFDYKDGAFTFVGLSNFRSVLASPDYPLGDPLNFWTTLSVTVLWTVLNVALHVVIGVALALLLRRPWVALRGAYRVALVLPWAIPSYITALAWRGLFDREMGAINAIIVALGGEPVSWFGRFATAFAANVTTNVWLGFPFMLVVTLGALQAIPEDLEEVAALEGASRWQTFRRVTLPAIGPALGPAVVLGSVWTFNMFNVIYLVSGGEPAGATEILISQVYRWAFKRNQQYGIAAAYAVLIFLILLAYSRLFIREEEEARP